MASTTRKSDSSDTDLSLSVSTPSKHVSTLGLVFLCYSIVSGGPVGIESSVQVGGALATVLGLLAVGTMFSMPLALIVAEMSTTMPSNGGNIDWVIAALGKPAGIANAAAAMFSYTFDLPLYPSLLSAALSQVLNINQVADICIRLGVIALAFGLNVIGVDAINAATTALTIFVLIPFLMLPMVAAGMHSQWDWTALTPAATPPSLAGSIGVFVAGLMWNMQGWPSAGNLAAEIANPQRSFPVGVILAVILVISTYSYSVLFGAALHPNLDDWEDGYLVNVAAEVVRWLGGWTAVAAAVSSMSTFLSSMATYSRALQAVAKDGILPIPWLAKDMTRFNSPVPALLVFSATTVALAFVDLSSLLIFDTTFNNISMLLVVFSFLALRMREPNRERPFSVPGGLPAAIAATTSCVIMICFGFYATGTDTWWAPIVTIGSAIAIWAVTTAVFRCKRQPEVSIAETGEYEVLLAVGEHKQV